jgi:hypothetical protein
VWKTLAVLWNSGRWSDDGEGDHNTVALVTVRISEEVVDDEGKSDEAYEGDSDTECGVGVQFGDVVGGEGEKRF